jgi:hypothetical protein
MKRAAIVVMALLLPLGAFAQGVPVESLPTTSGEGEARTAPQPPRTTTQSICLMIEAAAAANGLPLDYFVRVIWRESNFRADAVGPRTRSGNRAQGIAQFMPGTAEERALLDPFDPVQALPKAAEFLRELRAEFGNIGLAAAAYNAGPRRVRDWLAGRGALPGETQRYVEAVTGRTAEEWSAGKATTSGAATPPQSDCLQTVALLRRGTNPFIDELQQHVTASAGKPWGVQVSAGFSRERVLASYSSIERAHRGMLEGLDMVIQQTMLRSRGTRPLYQVRIGADSRGDANALCTRLHAARVACMVLRNRA